MNPTQPKDAEMDEKKFPPRRFIDKNDSCYVGVYAYDFHIRKEGRTWDEYLSLEEHEAILSEERARLEEVKRLAKIQTWEEAAVLYSSEKNKFREMLLFKALEEKAKLKPPSRRRSER